VEVGHLILAMISHEDEHGPLPGHDGPLDERPDAGVELLADHSSSWICCSACWFYDLVALIQAMEESSAGRLFFCSFELRMKGAVLQFCGPELRYRSTDGLNVTFALVRASSAQRRNNGDMATLQQYDRTEQIERVSVSTNVLALEVVATGEKGMPCCQLTCHMCPEAVSQQQLLWPWAR